MEKNVRRRTTVAPPLSSLSPPPPPLSSPSPSLPTTMTTTTTKIAPALPRLPTALLACVFSHGSTADLARLARCCTLTAAVARLPAASPRLVRYRGTTGAWKPWERHQWSEDLPETPVGLLRCRPSAFATSEHAWLAPNQVTQLVASGCFGRALTALDIRYTPATRTPTEIVVASTAFLGLAVAAPDLRHLVVRLVSGRGLDGTSDDSAGQGPASNAAPMWWVDQPPVSAPTGEDVADVFAHMSALHTLAFSEAPYGRMRMRLPPALHALHIGRGGGHRRWYARIEALVASCYGHATLRELTLPAIHANMWRPLTAGLPHLTSLESLTCATTEPHDAAAGPIELPNLGRFACATAFLATLRPLRMPNLHTLGLGGCRDFFHATLTRDFHAFLERIPAGVRTLSIRNSGADPFRYYCRPPDDRNKLPPEVVFRSLTSLTIGADSGGDAVNLSRYLATMFPALTHAKVDVVFDHKFLENPADSCEPHTRVVSLDYGGSELGAAQFRQLPQRFPRLTELVAPDPISASWFVDTLLGWRATLTALDLSRGAPTTDVTVEQLEQLLVDQDVHHTLDGGGQLAKQPPGRSSPMGGGGGGGGGGVVRETHARRSSPAGRGLGVLRRLRLAHRHRALAADIDAVLERRRTFNSGATEVAIEWAPSKSDQAVSLASPFCDF